MGIQLATNFEPRHNLPIDFRTVFPTMADFEVSPFKVVGQPVYINDEKKHYPLSLYCHLPDSA